VKHSTRYNVTVCDEIGHNLQTRESQPGTWWRQRGGTKNETIVHDKEEQNNMKRKSDRRGDGRGWPNGGWRPRQLSAEEARLAPGVLPKGAVKRSA